MWLHRFRRRNGGADRNDTAARAAGVMIRLPLSILSALSLVAFGGTAGAAERELRVCVDPNTNATYCGASGDCIADAGVTCPNGFLCDGTGTCSAVITPSSGTFARSFAVVFQEAAGKETMVPFGCVAM